MKFGVVVFPGSNCDHDMMYILENKLSQEVIPLWHKDTDLQGIDAIALPGGFSYGDYLRSGAIARYSPLMNEVIKFANKGGYVFGICNGFQILWVIANSHDNAFTANVPKKPLNIPIAHGEGRYYASEKTIKELEDNNQILYRYCDNKGNITPEANPNGSVNNIAGVCNSNKNVFGMMPHPERAGDEELTNIDGLFILKSFINKLEERTKS
jgi:phosphoribosylformylglycinamidine (FGAM) synthase-like amidotransferase family enzyme